MTVGEYPDRTGDAKGKAEESGFEVIVADDFTLLLDIDTAADLELWGRSSGRLQDYGIKAVSVEDWKSKSGNLHVKIVMAEPMPLRSRVGLESILGSDRKRASLSYREYGIAEYPCMLFKPKKPEAA